MKKCQKSNVQNFTKLTRRSGISLIVLVITIIVILILAAAVILTINNNNPIAEANKARYESDRANMQAIFTNAVAKVMTQNRATVSVTVGQINTTISGVKEATGEVSYTVTNAMNSNNSSGKIMFDKGTNTDTIFYTGKKLPIYAAGDTKWYVDNEGNISLEVAGIAYGNGKIMAANSLIMLYEDLAGDEEGATEGKLHIGDYVNYNPIADGITEKTVANGYKYVSANDVTGVTEASSDEIYSSSLSGITEQSFTAQDNLKWKVLGIDGDSILITTEDPIMSDNRIDDENIGLFMYGAKAYINAIQEITNISKIYGNNNLAKSARGMTIEDINNIAGVTVTEDSISPNIIESVATYAIMSPLPYGSEYSFDSGSEYGWSPEAWLAKKEGDTSPGISGKVNGYEYDLANTNLKTADITSVKYNLINRSIPYYLASRGVKALFSNNDFGFACFGPGAVFDGYVDNGIRLFDSDGDSLCCAYGVRPVVYLKSEVIGELQSTDTSGVSTWNIEL